MNKQPTDLDAFEADAISCDIRKLLQKQRSGCPPLALLRASSAGALADEQQSTVTAHVAACRACRALQLDLGVVDSTDASPQEVDQILARVHRLAGGAEGARPGRFQIFTWRTAAATAALVACAVLALWRFQTPQQPSPASPQVVELKPAPAPQIPAALRLEKPAVKLTLSALAWRGNNNIRTQFLKDMAPALDAYRADHFSAAAGTLETLSGKYPESVEVFFYLGVCRLFAAEFSAAIKALEQAARLADDSFSADVSWYLSISYHRSGQIGTARIQLERLCGGSSEYAARSCEALRELKST